MENPAVRDTRPGPCIQQPGCTRPGCRQKDRAADRGCLRHRTLFGLTVRPRIRERPTVADHIGVAEVSERLPSLCEGVLTVDNWAEVAHIDQLDESLRLVLGTDTRSENTDPHAHDDGSIDGAGCWVGPLDWTS